MKNATTSSKTLHEINNELAVLEGFGSRRKPRSGRRADCGNRKESGGEIMIKWQRDAGMFARRIVHSDLHGFVARGFIIEQGTKALFFENGVLQQVVRAGKIETSGLLTRLLTLDFHRRVEIVVCEAGDIHFAYLYGGENPQTP